MSNYNSPNKHWEVYQKLRKRLKPPADWGEYRKGHENHKKPKKDRVYDT